jgi:predicted dehydrogenase
MIREARKNNLMLSVFHNRRFDGNFLALKETIEKGLIGKIFRIEAFYGGFRNPLPSWRSDMKLSGGLFYDWGSHFIDWILNLHPESIKGVYGFSRKFVWNYSSTEDEVEAIILFEDGAIADLQGSTIASVRKPAWRILGTKGGIIDPYPTLERTRPTSFLATVYKNVDGSKPPQRQPGMGRRIPQTPPKEEMRIDYKPAGADGPAGWHHYYINIAEHLLKGKDLIVKPEEGAKVIAIIEAAKKSSNSGIIEKIQTIQ